MTRALTAWLAAYRQGPDLESNDCRKCHRAMTPMPESATEPTALCHSCAQELLELLVPAFIIMDAARRARYGLRRRIRVPGVNDY
jgi:hypothetical protein